MMMDRGYLVANRYRIVDTLGEGGMANVYLAEDEFLHRRVAVKVLRMDLQHDQATIRRFQREARATCELSHPNIVSVYDVGSDDGMQYIVMEFIDGMDLKAYIDQNYPISLPRIQEMMLQILSAVQLAHSKGIIHRDLKPQNILINQDGVAKIADFGIAVALNDQSVTQTNSLMGSVHYISPEQARGGMATQRSDIYALGIILYELLTGKVPFAGDSAVTIALKHFKSEIPSLRDFNQNIPQPLENVVLKATAKLPEQRYQSAADMALDIETVLDVSRKDEPKFISNVPDMDLAETKLLADLPSDTKEALKNTEPEPVAEEKKPEQKPIKSRKKMWWLIGGLVTLIVIIIGLILILGNNDVNVPDLTGMSQSEAKNVLTESKLKVGKLTYENSSSIEKGLVVRSLPKKTTSVKEKSEVGLVISKGSEKYKLGDYSELTYSVVKAKLKKLGFTVKKKSKTSSAVSSGQIMAQSIDPDTKVIPAETTITFTVSVGEKMVTVRDLTTYYSKKDAEDYADSVGLVLKFTYEYSDTVKSSYVISQRPAAGEQVAAGSTITLVLSQGENPNKSSSNSSSESSSSSQASPSETDKMTIKDLSGETLAQAKTYLASIGMSISIKQVSSETVAAGIVISQSPAGNSSVSKGSTITVTVSSGASSSNSSTTSGTTN